jgi:hypothetical protein
MRRNRGDLRLRLARAAEDGIFFFVEALVFFAVLFLVAVLLDGEDGADAWVDDAEV